MLIRVDSIPHNAKEVPRRNGEVVVTHSETGHDHVITRPKVTLYEDAEDPLTAWLEVSEMIGLPVNAELVHKRDHDTHETIEIQPGKYRVARQREYTPQGWRRAQD